MCILLFVLFVHISSRFFLLQLKAYVHVFTVIFPLMTILLINISPLLHVPDWVELWIITPGICDESWNSHHRPSTQMTSCGAIQHWARKCSNAACYGFLSVCQSLVNCCAANQLAVNKILSFHCATRITANRLISWLTLIIKPYLESLSFRFHLKEEVSQLPHVITRNKLCLHQCLHYICSITQSREDYF